MLGNFCTVGHFTGLYQKHPMQIKAALRELGLKPALCLNDLHYYAAADLEAAIKWINLDPSRNEVTAEIPNDE